ncbi:MFS transporter [Chloroflexota bacterium]
MQNKGPKLRRKIFYGWFVVAISFTIMTIAYGVYLSWPVFYVAILAEFGWSRADTALIFSIGSIIYGLASPVAGFLFDKFGPRKLFIIAAIILLVGTVGASRSSTIYQFGIFYGIFIAFGTICVGFVPHAAMISNWFTKKRGTALGIAQAGTRDAFLLAPLIQLAILAMGWRDSYLVLAAAVTFIIIPLSMFLRAKPQDMGLLPDGVSAIEYKGQRDKKQSEVDALIVDKTQASKQWTLLKAIRGYRFWALFSIMFGAGFSFTSLINHFVALTTDLGFSAIFAASLLTIYAVTGMIGRSCGFISDFIGREVAFTISIAITLLSLPLLFIIEDTSASWMLYLFIFCFGIGNGLVSPVYTAAASDLYQGRQFGTIIGFANIGYGIAASLGTWLYGYIFDVTRTYTFAIVAAMLGGALMVIAMWVAAPRHTRQ